jgi:hypothetical protein
VSSPDESRTGRPGSRPSAGLVASRFLAVGFLSTLAGPLMILDLSPLTDRLEYPGLVLSDGHGREYVAAFALVAAPAALKGANRFIGAVAVALALAFSSFFLIQFTQFSPSIRGPITCIFLMCVMVATGLLAFGRQPGTVRLTYPFVFGAIATAIGAPFVFIASSLLKDETFGRVSVAALVGAIWASASVGDWVAAARWLRGPERSYDTGASVDEEPLAMRAFFRMSRMRELALMSILAGVVGPIVAIRARTMGFTVPDAENGGVARPAMVEHPDGTQTSIGPVTYSQIAALLGTAVTDGRVDPDMPADLSNQDDYCAALSRLDCENLHGRCYECIAKGKELWLVRRQRPVDAVSPKGSNSPVSGSTLTRPDRAPDARR